MNSGLNLVFSRSLLGLSMCTVCGLASAQVTLTGLAGTAAGYPGSSSNGFQDNLGTTSASFVVGNKIQVHSGSVASYAVSNTSSNVMFCLQNSAYPNRYLIARNILFPSLSAVPYNITARQVDAWGDLSGSVVPVGSTWKANYGMENSAPYTTSVTFQSVSLTVHSGSVAPSLTYSHEFIAPNLMETIGPLGYPGNPRVTFDPGFTSTVLLTGKFTIHSGSIEPNSTIGSWSDDVEFKLVSSSNPFDYWTERLVDKTYYQLPLTFSDTRARQATESRAHASVPGTTYLIEFYERHDDSVGSSIVESTIRNLRIGFETISSANFGFESTIETDVPVVSGARSPLNSVVQLGIVTSSFLMSGDTYLGHCEIQQVSTLSTNPSMIFLRLRNSAFPGHYGDIAASSYFYYPSSGLTSDSHLFGIINGFIGPKFRSRLIPAGSVWSAEPFVKTGEDPNSVDAILRSFDLRILSTQLAPAASTSLSQSATHLGVIDSIIAPQTAPISRSVGQSGAWFRLDLPNGLLTEYFLDARVNINFSQPHVRLYDSEGRAVSNVAGGRQPDYMTFGAANPIRYIGSVALKGQDRESLPPGSYYLGAAWGTFTDQLAYGMPFEFATNFRDFAVSIYTNQPPGTAIRGKINLNGLANSMSIAKAPIKIEAQNASGQTVFTGTTSVWGDGSYAILLPVPNGNYKITATLPTSLKTSTTMFLPGASTAKDWNLLNGNCDADSGDDEVGPSDLQIVLDNFGRTTGFDARADLDRNGEVGSGDLQIVLDNFGQIGD
jgi:hypothetical protein